MKQITLILFLLSIVKFGWSQNANIDYKRAFKIYNLTSFEKVEIIIQQSDTSTPYILSSSSDLQIFHPTFAFQWKTKNNNFQEVELTYLVLGKQSTTTELKDDPTNGQQIMSGNKLVTSHISVQYEYIKMFNKLKDKKLVPSVGFGFNPYYKQINSTPQIATSYPKSEKYLGAKVFITPRLNYYINSKFFVDVNIPFCIANAYLLTKNSGDPTLTKEERTMKSFNFQQFPFILSARVGVGFKF